MKNARRSVVFAGAALVAASAGPARAQEARAPGEPAAGASMMTGDVFFKAEAEGPVIAFAYGREGGDGEVVKGAPYSAEAVTEFVQTLVDGNRITRKTTATVYRDGQGRTRREQNLGAIPGFATDKEPHEQILIQDPVAGKSYVLDPRAKAAQKIEPPHFIVSKEGPKARREKVESDKAETVVVERRTVRSGKVGEAPPDVFTMPVPPPGEGGLPGLPMGGFGIAEKRRLPNGKSEELGKQSIEGVEAEGARTTVTIPAGDVGNEQPIQIVTERWYAPDLQAVVLSRHSDPRFGETTYRLTNIVRSEPDRALFEVPADFKVNDEPPADVFIRKMEKDVKPRE